MATVPTPEDSARAILAIFKSKDVRAGGILMAGQVNLQFLTSGGKAADYEAGGQYAIAHGWIELSSSTMKLTDAGFAEM